MFGRLLARVAAAETVHLGELADELGVTVPVVRDMLTDLALRGYLRPLGGECNTRCGGCAFAAGCHGESATQAWALTERGRAAVEAA